MSESPAPDPSEIDRRLALVEDENQRLRHLVETLMTSLADAVGSQIDSKRSEIIEQTLTMVRSEYTVMPRFFFHQPMDYLLTTPEPDYQPAVNVPDDPLPLPPDYDRYGYPSDNEEYLATGRLHHDRLMSIISRHRGVLGGMTILDFGCATGRVLRHFATESRLHGWKLCGVDVQARCIEWLRQNFPKEFEVCTVTALPTLPFADRSFDVIYGISVFTHIKFLWDMWLLELKRVLRPRGLLIQTHHCEPAWEFYRQHGEEDWVRNNFPAAIADHPEVPGRYLLHGDATVSQTFWRETVLRTYWERHFTVLEIHPPDNDGFQNWVVCQKEP